MTGLTCIFDATPASGWRTADGIGLLAGDLDTAARSCVPPLHPERKAGAAEQAGHESGIHRADDLTM
jgi:hypothetical protein